MQRLDVNKNGINGWYCTTHNLYNDILRIECQYCNELRDESLAAIATSVKLRREGTMSQVERELHADFFTRWCRETDDAIAGMNEEQMTAWRNEMAKIALEAKAKTAYVDDKLRELKAKRLKDGKPWLVAAENQPDMQGVKTRKERMSKVDKINAGLLDLMSPEDAAALMNRSANKKNSSITSETSRKLNDVVTIQPEVVKTFNTRESLLADISDSIVKGIINNHPIEDLVSATKTAGHLANKILGPVKPIEDDEPFDFTKLGD